VSTILVTGGTGNLGRHLVPLLQEGSTPGTGVRVMSRHPRPDEPGVEHVVADTAADTGLAEAVRGVDTVVHLAGTSKGDEVGTANLVRAAARSGTRHLVLISVIAADKVPLAYYRSKHRGEQIVEASGIPFTLLRAAQFHDFVWNMLAGLTRMPVVPAPRGARLEPVDVAEVAARLAELAHGEPQGRVPDLAGPQVLAAATLLRGILTSRGVRRPLMPIPVPGAVGRAYRDGDNLARTGSARGTRTWGEYLLQRPAPATA
jgi:uncharacterized protein YbjT (DUF2867 family)